MRTRPGLTCATAGRLICATAILLFVPGGVQAQDAKGYIEGTVAMSATAITTDGTVSAQLGIGIRPHVLAFMDVGRIPVALRMSPPAVDGAPNEQSVAGVENLVFASCVLGGLRLEMPEHNGWTPYVSSAFGVARGPSSDGRTSISNSPSYRFSGGLDMSLLKTLSADIGYAVTYMPFSDSAISQGITVSLLLRF